MDVTHITSDRGYARLKGTVISSSQSKGFRSFPLHTDPLQITSSKQWPNFSLAERSTSEAMKRYLSFTRSMDVNTCVYQLFIWVIPMMDMWRLCGDQLSPKYRRMIFSVLNNCHKFWIVARVKSVSRDICYACLNKLEKTDKDFENKPNTLRHLQQRSHPYKKVLIYNYSK